MVVVHMVDKISHFAGTARIDQLTTFSDNMLRTGARAANGHLENAHIAWSGMSDRPVQQGNIRLQFLCYTRAKPSQRQDP